MDGQLNVHMILSTGPLDFFRTGNHLYATRMLTRDEIEEVTWVSPFPVEWVNDHFLVSDATDT